MANRLEQTPGPLRMSMLDGDKVEQEIQQTNRLVLPKGTKAILLLSLPDISLGNANTANLDTITLNEDFIGAPRQVLLSEAYYELPKAAMRIDVFPDSDERRGYIQERRTFYESEAYKKKAGERKDYSSGYILRKAFAEEEPYAKEIAAIDKQLAAEFLAGRQEDLELFNIDPDKVRRVRLQVAVDRNIQLFL